MQRSLRICRGVLLQESDDLIRIPLEIAGAGSAAREKRIRERRQTQGQSFPHQI